MTRRAARREPLPIVDLQSDSLGYAIKLAQVRSYALIYRMCGPEGLSPGRMTALSYVSIEPGINQSTLAQRLNITRASVMKVVDALEGLGFITRDSLPSDRRSHALMLTPAGHKRLLLLQERIDRFELELASALSNSERSQLIELLSKVAPNESGVEDQNALGE